MLQALNPALAVPRQRIVWGGRQLADSEVNPIVCPDTQLNVCLGSAGASKRFQKGDIAAPVRCLQTSPLCTLQRVEEGVLCVHITLRRAAGIVQIIVIVCPPNLAVYQSTNILAGSNPTTPGSQAGWSAPSTPTSPFSLPRSPPSEMASDQLSRSASAPATMSPGGR